MDSSMTPERWQQIKTVLCDALELEAQSAREAYLIAACGSDVDLRREVESLLEPFPDQVEAFADNLRATLGHRVWTEPTGQRLGAYRIVSEIGRGGMGSVYLAERADGQFEKTVAIKLLKRGIDTEEILKRFQAERQILARLEHPNIARLIDAGTTDDGLPYFIMEHVDGAPVTRLVREKGLPLPDRLELFLKICSAVEFAHQNGVVHRDLKPSNILVTAAGEPKLLDFGIAKLTAHNGSDDEVTSVDQRRLTASYASPEQAAGEPVTYHSDIYALGAVLYEMLSGDRPHRFSTPNPSLEEVSRVLRESEPNPPSRVAVEPELQHQIKGDLDRIILRALRKHPQDRYSSVKEFADDIRRFLSGNPVRADRRQLRPVVFVGTVFIATLVLTAAIYLYPR